MTSVKLTVDIAQRDDLLDLDASALERRLDQLRSVMSQLDAFEATILGALSTVRRRPVKPKPSPEPAPTPGQDPVEGFDDEDATDEADHGEGEAQSAEEAPAPKPSVKEQNERAARALRLLRFPDVGAALAAGRITTEQADLLTESGLPNGVIDQLLREAIACGSTDQTRRSVANARKAHDRLNPEQRLAHQQAASSGSWWWDDDGMFCMFLKVDPITGDVIETLLDGRLKVEWQTGDKDAKVRRTPKQRQAAAIVATLTGTSKATGPGGVNAVIDLDNIGANEAWTLSGQPIPASSLEFNTAEVYAWVLSNGGHTIRLIDGNLDEGRDARHATPLQRIALAIRDGHCIWDSCNMPPGRCVAHHLIDWAKGGLTNIDNLALLCPAHHTEFHNTGLILRPGEHAGQWHLIEPHTGRPRRKWTNPPPRTQRSRRSRSPVADRPPREPEREPADLFDRHAPPSAAGG